MDLPSLTIYLSLQSTTCVRYGLYIEREEHREENQRLSVSIDGLIHCEYGWT